MTTLSILKTAATFIGGAFFAIFIISLAIQSENEKVLGAHTEIVEQAQSKVKEKVAEKENQQLGVLSQVWENTLSAIANAPILAPIMKTQKEVSTTTESVKNLPTDQRNAICKQICGN